MIFNKLFRKIIFFALLILIIINAFVFFHAYRFTHYVEKPDKALSGKIENESIFSLLFNGIEVPRPVNTEKPKREFKTIKLLSNDSIECWLINHPSPKGTVIIFHGYTGAKCNTNNYAEEFYQMGFNTFQVDFMGSGGSKGNLTTFGMKEAKDVCTAFNYIKQQKEKNIILFGSSLGAVSIMKAIKDSNINPVKIILECPFATFLTTVKNRFKLVGLPSPLIAELLVFWGSIQMGNWGFSHKPVEYADRIKCPTLLLYGAKDKYVSAEEINNIYANLNGPKKLKIFVNSGHENYLNNSASEWRKSVKEFLGI